ncbi:CapA family protein [Anaerococcus tetradius]|uniref:Bacterial capsule synthesis protein n=1 Tax=Anaerococcus tetradius ATCC 35098 TaxID=525255 RepID=C2CH36_9FIRM|nr:CapA family protein [Anaerococcus tetradius]EEI83102.1 bacterial capsule synthesis protein [Anaerococcus tetradius ATCC 35098]
MKKTILNILTSLTLLMLLVGCGLNSKTTVDTNAKNTSDLLENLDKATNEEVSEEEGDKITDSKKSDRENAKSRWERSLAKEKNDKKAQAKEKKERAIADKEIKKDKKTISKNKEKDEDKEGDYTKIKAKFFGDTMAHIGQVQYALAYGGGEYDFSNQFSYIKDYVKDSDLAITNYETTSDPNREYSGYPAFNTPASYLKNIKEAGFDVVTTANNHALDTDEEGVQTTIEAIKEAGLDFVGTKAKESDKILYKEINGIKVAILAYTYGANGKEDLLDVRDEVSSLNYLNEENVKSDIEEAKKNSCDFIIVYPHWGIEYESYPTDETIKLAHKMVDWGADLVIGNHPHVVQPVEVYKSEDGREGIIAYALGNFISKQSLEVSGDIRVEQALSIEVTLEKDKKTGKKKLSDMKLHPLWVGTNYDQYGASSKTYLCEDFLEGGSKYDLVDDNMRARIQQAYDMTIKTAKTEVKE